MIYVASDVTKLGLWQDNNLVHGYKYCTSFIRSSTIMPGRCESRGMRESEICPSSVSVLWPHIRSFDP